MKRVIFLIAMMGAAMGGMAQDVELTDGGAYEKKEVVTVDSVSSGVLFVRAMEALSDWTGPDGKAKAGVDFQDKETGTVIYKGRYSLGFKSTFLGDGWSRYADFTLKVKTKDGRAQVTVTVPTVTAVYSRGNVTRTNTVAELWEGVKKAKGDKHDRGLVLMNDLLATANEIAFKMMDRLKNGSEDDDF